MNRSGKIYSVLGFLTLLAISGCSTRNKSLQVYDYDLVVSLNHLSFEPDLDYQFMGLSSGQNGTSMSLFKYSYSYSDSLRRVPVDTLAVVVTPTVVDSLLVLSARLFDLSEQVVETHKTIPPPPSINDGLIATVVLDLGYRGDKFERFVSDVSMNSKLQDLIDLFERQFRSIN